MAFVIDADLEMLPPSTKRVGQPKFLIRGPRRRIARAALAKLQNLIKADQREGARATRLEYTPLFATVDQSTMSNEAVLSVITNLQAVLAMKG